MEQCENCGRGIGNLETPYVFNDHIDRRRPRHRLHVVCKECHALLSAHANPSPAARPAPPLASPPGDQDFVESPSSATSATSRAIASPPPQPFIVTVAQREPGSGYATASLVLGLVGLFIWPCGILALIFGEVAQLTARKRGAPRNGMATAGKVLGWIPIIFSAVLFYLGMIMGSWWLIILCLPMLLSLLFFGVWAAYQFLGVLAKAASRLTLRKKSP